MSNCFFNINSLVLEAASAADKLVSKDMGVMDHPNAGLRLRATAAGAAAAAVYRAYGIEDIAQLQAAARSGVKHIGDDDPVDASEAAR